MKKLSILFLLFATLSSHGSQTPIPAAELVNPNLIQDPGFESSGYGWTASGGATKTANTTAKGTGTKGYDWDSNASSQTLDSASITIPAGYYGKNGHAFCTIKTPSGTATHTLTVYDGSSNIVTPATIVSSSSVFAKSSVNFIFPSSGTLKLRLTSVASNEPEVYIDDCYLGIADNIVNISQAQFVGECLTPATASCTWPNTSTSLADVPADTDCPTPTLSGSAAAPGTKIPACVFNNLSPGNYVVLSDFSGGASGGPTSSRYQVTDGTTATSLKTYVSGSNPAGFPVSLAGHYSYTSAQSSVTFKIQSERTAGTSTDIPNTASMFRIALYKYPSTQETAYRPDLTNWVVDAYISGADIDLGTSALASDTDIANGSLTLTNTARGTLSAQVACASGTASSGTTCTAANEIAGIAFTSPIDAPQALVCASGTYGGNGGEIAYFRINKTSNTSSTTTTAGTQIKSAGGNANGSTASFKFPFTVCDILPVTVGQNTFRLQYQMDTGTGSGTSNLLYANTKGENIKWNVQPVTQTIPSPILVGSVVNNSSSVSAIYSAEVSITGVVTENLGVDWINGNCAVTVTSLYTCTLNSGYFTSAPDCVAVRENSTNSTSNPVEVDISSESTSTVAVYTHAAESNAARAAAFRLLCFGGK